MGCWVSRDRFELEKKIAENRKRTIDDIETLKSLVEKVEKTLGAEIKELREMLLETTGTTYSHQLAMTDVSVIGMKTVPKEEGHLLCVRDCRPIP